jgi:hypothetical protein
MVAQEVIPRNHELALESFRANGWYPAVDPPRLNRRGGDVQVGFVVTIESSGGTTYVTWDGTDPRASGGAVSTSARVYAGPITLHESAVIQARTLSPDGTWSALEQGRFDIEVVDPNRSNLVITEFHYHPATADKSEFIELTNLGDRTIRLDGVHVRGGVHFTFPTGARIEPGERIVLVENRDDFRAVYGDAARIGGVYSGKLSNGGELFELVDASGTVLQSIDYDDDNGWPAGADGPGFSMQLLFPDISSSLASNWRASAIRGGTPGRVEYPVGDANLDGRFDSSDLVLIFQVGKYQTGIQASWQDGDWNGDLRFDSRDLVLAFQKGTFVAAAQTSSLPTAITNSDDDEEEEE